MIKQYFTTEIGRILNPPVLSKFDQVTLDALEKVYASSKAPLGHTKISNNPEIIEKHRDYHLDKNEDSVSLLVYPSTRGVCRSIYTDSFHPPSRSRDDLLPAGLKTTLQKGKQNNPITSVDGCKKTAIIPITHWNSFSKRIDTCAPSHVLDCHGDKNAKPTENSSNLLEDLWNVSKPTEFCPFRKFTYFLRSYLQHFKEKFTLNDLQKMYHKLGLFVHCHSLTKVLSRYSLLEENGDLCYPKFLKCLQWRPLLDGLSVQCVSAVDWKQPSDISAPTFKTTYSEIGCHSDSGILKPAGLSTVRSDLVQPPLVSLNDTRNYGDVRDVSHLLKPDVFKQLGIYEKDIDLIQTEQQVKCLFSRSGICVEEAAISRAFDVVSEDGRANILKLWNKLKEFRLTDPA